MGTCDLLPTTADVELGSNPRHSVQPSQAPCPNRVLYRCLACSWIADQTWIAFISCATAVPTATFAHFAMMRCALWRASMLTLYTLLPAPSPNAWSTKLNKKSCNLRPSVSCWRHSVARQRLIAHFGNRAAASRERRVRFVMTRCAFWSQHLF